MLWSGEPTLNLAIYFQRGGSKFHYDACFPKAVLPMMCVCVCGEGVHYRGKNDYAETRIAFLPLWKIGLCLL